MGNVTFSFSICKNTLFLPHHQKKHLLFVFSGGVTDDQLLGHDFLIDIRITLNMTQQQLAGGSSHQVRLVLDGRQARGHIGGMGIIRETDQGNILRNVEPLLLDGGKSGESNDIVEGKNGIRTVASIAT